jgi:hypothetical protein
MLFMSTIRTSLTRAGKPATVSPCHQRENVALWYGDAETLAEGRMR